MGYLLDSYPGARGHEFVFGVMALFGVLGWILSLLFRRVSKRIIDDPNRLLVTA